MEMPHIVIHNTVTTSPGASASLIIAGLPKNQAELIGQPCTWNVTTCSSSTQLFNSQLGCLSPHSPYLFQVNKVGGQELPGGGLGCHT
jgi:hypothetical protein